MQLRLQNNGELQWKKYLMANDNQKATMAKIKIVQVKSGIDRPQRQKRTLIALGIRKMNTPVIHEATPQILGMVDSVKHLLHVEEANV